MNFVNYASANRRERLNPPERLMIRSERLIAKQKKVTTIILLRYIQLSLN